MVWTPCSKRPRGASAFWQWPLLPAAPAGSSSFSVFLPCLPFPSYLPSSGHFTCCHVCVLSSVSTLFNRHIPARFPGPFFQPGQVRSVRILPMRYLHAFLHERDLILGKVAAEGIEDGPLNQLAHMLEQVPADDCRMVGFNVKLVRVSPVLPPMDDTILIRVNTFL